VRACYQHPTSLCSEPIEGTVRILTNSCPTYSGSTQATILPNIGSGGRLFSLIVQDPDQRDAGKSSFQIIGDTASVNDFTIDDVGNVRAKASYKDSSVSRYNTQIIVRDNAGYSPCFLPVSLTLTVERNLYQPQFSNSSSELTVLETLEFYRTIVTLRVSKPLVCTLLL